MKKDNYVTYLMKRGGKISDKIILQYHEMLKQHQNCYLIMLTLAH